MSMNDGARFTELGMMSVEVPHFDGLVWRCHTRVEKRWGDFPGGLGIETEDPYDVQEVVGNLLLYGGASAVWERLIGTSTHAAFSNANAQIGVGDSSTAEAATQTDLQASSNKVWQAMDATYPQHTDGTTSTNRDCVFKSSFDTSTANFAWAEWGIRVNQASPRLLNRKVQSFGTKATGTWTLTITLTLA